MTRLRFHQGLDELKRKLLVMGGLAEQAVDRATQAYQTRDRSLCELVLKGEQAINFAEREIDELALDLLAMQQPMAVDLRFIVAVLKINADLERVGDQAVNITERVVDLLELPHVELPVDVAHMASLVREMIRRALEAFIRGDADVAQTVLEADDKVDRINRETFQLMNAMVQQSTEAARQAINVLLISRNLERVADHATNIAEDVIFWVQGADVRHRFGSGASPKK